jgi:hypothetical protein
MRRSHVVFPVPCGPNRKKEWSGRWNRRANITSRLTAKLLVVYTNLPRILLGCAEQSVNGACFDMCGYLEYLRRVVGSRRRIFWRTRP